jgi:hypothetical protein
MPIQHHFVTTFEIGGSMQIKTGDLVYRKQHRAFNTPHNYEIWLVLGEHGGAGGFASYVRIENVHNGNRIQVQPHMLMKIENGQKMTVSDLTDKQ